MLRFLVILIALTQTAHALTCTVLVNKSRVLDGVYEYHPVIEAETPYWLSAYDPQGTLMFEPDYIEPKGLVKTYFVEAHCSLDGCVTFRTILDKQNKEYDCTIKRNY